MEHHHAAQSPAVDAHESSAYAALDGLDAHARPPEVLKVVYKQYQKLRGGDLDARTDLIDHSTNDHVTVKDLHGVHGQAPPDDMQRVFDGFVGLCHVRPSLTARDYPELPARVYEVSNMPGRVDVILECRPARRRGAEKVEKLFHRDLSNPEHKTNMHMHYNVPYPSSTAQESGDPVSFFHTSATDLIFTPKDPTVHKPITTELLLNKKLRWVTLGGQYDWTNKVYPSNEPPAFPADIKKLIEEIFTVKAEAAIVNLYSPGDTLSLHRDVSEECDRPLLSISLGCEGIFIAGLDELDEEGSPRVATMRLRSGDAVVMSDRSRYAWHGVPKVLEGTCPEWMQEWPWLGTGEERGVDERWKGWMTGKRINLNVRQMFA